jgi:hypothetical protein
MKDLGRILWLTTGVVLGVVGAALYLAPARPVLAANDRFEDYTLCTGPVAIQPGAPTDGIWLLDYKSGKLLASVIDRGLGKITSWAEVDLVTEFALQPKQNVHFLMTTGVITQGQAALYLAETSTGKLGIYTMGPRPDSKPGVAVRRHDMVLFRPGAMK